MTQVSTLYNYVGSVLVDGTADMWMDWFSYYMHIYPLQPHTAMVWTVITVTEGE